MALPASWKAVAGFHRGETNWFVGREAPAVDAPLLSVDAHRNLN